MGRNKVHELNRDHIAAPGAELLAGLRLELWKRLRETLGSWEVKPIYACVFGSAARGDGGPDSDIDVLLVRKPLGGDPAPRNGQKGFLGVLSDVIMAMGTTPMTSAESSTWQSQVDELHLSVQRWTGNTLHVVEISFWQWASLSQTDPALFAEVERDAITLAGGALPRTAGAR
jgi:hypothetical protein